MELSGLPGRSGILNDQDRAGALVQNLGQKGQGKTAEGSGIPALAAHHLVQGAEPQADLCFPGGPEQVLQCAQAERAAPRRFVRCASVGAKSVRPLRVGGGCRGRRGLRLKGEAALKIRNAATQFGKRCAMFGFGGHRARLFQSRSHLFSLCSY